MGSGSAVFWGIFWDHRSDFWGQKWDPEVSASSPGVPPFLSAVPTELWDSWVRCPWSCGKPRAPCFFFFRFCKAPGSWSLFFILLVTLQVTRMTFFGRPIAMRLFIIPRGSNLIFQGSNPFFPRTTWTTGEMHPCDEWENNQLGNSRQVTAASGRGLAWGFSPCMGISDEIDATIAIDETTILEIKATIWPRRFLRHHRLTLKFCSVNHPVIIECLFSSRISLASLFTGNHLCHYCSNTSNATRQNKIFLTYKRRFRWKIDEFVEKSPTKSTTSGTHTEAQPGFAQRFSLSCKTYFSCWMTVSTAPGSNQRDGNTDVVPWATLIKLKVLK